MRSIQTIDQIHVHPGDGMMSLQSTSLNNCRTTIWVCFMKMFRNSTTLRSLLCLSETSMKSREWNFLSHLRLKSPRFSNSLTKLSTGDNSNSYQWSHPSSSMTPRSVSLQCGQVFLWAWSLPSSCANFTTIMLITSTLPFLTTKFQLKRSTNDFPSLVEIMYSWSLTRSSPHFPLK